MAGIPASKFSTMDQVLSWASIFKPGYSDEYKQSNPRGHKPPLFIPYPLGLYIDTAKVSEPSTAKPGPACRLYIQQTKSNPRGQGNIPPLSKNFHFN